MYNVRHEKRKYKSGTKDELQRDQEVCPINCHGLCIKPSKKNWTACMLLSLEQVRLDPEEESALSAASTQDIMALADILNTNPQVSQGDPPPPQVSTCDQPPLTGQSSWSPSSSHRSVQLVTLLLLPQVSPAGHPPPPTGQSRW